VARARPSCRAGLAGRFRSTPELPPCDPLRPPPGAVNTRDRRRTDRRAGGGTNADRLDLGWEATRGWASGLPRKEVIQPQLPLRLPCYDFVPVTRPTLGRCPLAVSPRTSGVAGSHDVTGGVYKAREQIHRGMADPRLLATPTSRGRVAAPDPNWDRLWGLAPPRGFAARCAGHCSVRVAQVVRAMRT
jgi:hypothetical protein